jgi:hypothetical protein
MFTGKIDRDYVVHRHQKWWKKIKPSEDPVEDPATEPHPAEEGTNLTIL